MSQCEFKKDDGTQCKGHSLTGKNLCYFHNPETQEKVQASRSKGGKAACRPRKTAEESEYRLKTSKDVTDLLTDTINEVRTGAIDTKISNAVGYLANILLKSFEQGEMEERIRQLEEAIQKTNTGKGKG